MLLLGGLHLGDPSLGSLIELLLVLLLGVVQLVVQRVLGHLGRLARRREVLLHIRQLPPQRIQLGRVVRRRRRSRARLLQCSLGCGELVAKGVELVGVRLDGGA